MLVAVWPHLDERARRLVAGAAAGALGHGGIVVVAEAVGMRAGTVSSGMREVDSGAQLPGRVRHAGGGRKRLSERDPGLVAALLGLVEPDQRGDPMSPLRWTTKSLRHLATELDGAGYRCSHVTVGNLLREQGFSLQANFRTVEGKQHPDRDAQFGHINDTVKNYQATGDPVVSVDTKKKELVGSFASGGREWEPAGHPVRVNGHDFPDPELGKVIPYGIYDVSANCGWVGVGVDHDTAAFAVECLRRWWNTMGRNTYHGCTRLLITADAGGSNHHRSRTWKTELAAFALETGLEVTVCHFPPGASKWNRIEHHLFSHITMNWRGRPLSSHEVIVNTIAATTTRAGLTVHAELDTGTYDTGITITTEQIAALPLHPHHWHGDWNYTLRPEPPAPIPPSKPRKPRKPRATPPPAGQTRPTLAWLTHPAITGIATAEWDMLVHTMTTLHQHNLNEHRKRRGHHVLPPAERLLVTVLKKRLGMHQHVLGSIFGTPQAHISKTIIATTALLEQAGYTIGRAEQPETIRDNIFRLAHINGITIPPPLPGANRRFTF